MKTYVIGTPGGYDVEVKADSEQEAMALAERNWETMPRIIAEADGNVRVFERPNGQRYLVAPGYSTTDPERIEKVLSGVSAGRVSRDAIDNELIDANPLASRAASYLRGIPFARGWVDEGMGGLFTEGSAQSVRALGGAMERQRPGENLAIGAASGLLNAAATAGPVLGGASKIPGVGRLVQAAGNFITAPASRIGQALRAAPALGVGGAIEGAVAGAGEGRAAEEAGFGFVGGVVGGGASPYAEAGMRNVVDMLRRADVPMIAQRLGISDAAAKVIRNTFDRGGGLQQAQEALRRAGDEAMLADAGEAAQALLDAAASSGGEASQVARTAVDERMSRTQQSLTRGLDAQLGRSPIGPESAIRAIAARTAPQREAAYQAAFAEPIDWLADSGQRLISVLDRVEPAMKLEAIRRANAILRDEGLIDQMIDFVPSPNPPAGGVGPRQEMALTVRQLDALKKGLGEVAREANDATGIPGKTSEVGRRLGGQAGDLRQELGQNVPAYDDAVRIGGDKIAEENTFTAGRTALGPGTEVEDVLNALGRNPSQDALASGKAGLRMAFQKMMGDVKGLAADPLNPEAGQVIAALKAASSDNVKAKVAALLGPSETARLYAEFNKAAQSAIVATAMARNSKTAVRGAIREQVDEITAPGPMGSLARGEPLNTSRELIQIVTGMTDEYTAQQRQRVYADIARALTEKRGDEARAALAFLERAMAGEPLRQAENELLVREIAGALKLGGTSTYTAQASADERR